MNLSSSSIVDITFQNMTDRHKETRGPISSTKHSREELDPGIVSIHDELTFFRFQLS